MAGRACTTAKKGGEQTGTARDAGNAQGSGHGTQDEGTRRRREVMYQEPRGVGRLPPRMGARLWPRSVYGSPARVCTAQMHRCRPSHTPGHYYLTSRSPASHQLRTPPKNAIPRLGSAPVTAMRDISLRPARHTRPRAAAEQRVVCPSSAPRLNTSDAIRANRANSKSAREFRTAPPARRSPSNVLGKSAFGSDNLATTLGFWGVSPAYGHAYSFPGLSFSPRDCALPKTRHALHSTTSGHHDTVGLVALPTNRWWSQWPRSSTSIAIMEPVPHTVHPPFRGPLPRHASSHAATDTGPAETVTPFSRTTP